MFVNTLTEHTSLTKYSIIVVTFLTVKGLGMAEKSMIILCNENWSICTSRQLTTTDGCASKLTILYTYYQQFASLELVFK